MIMTRNKVKRLITMLTLALMATICAQAADISGIVVDKANQEPLIGATVMTGDKGTTTDIDGKFTIKGITTRNIHLIIIKEEKLHRTQKSEKGIVSREVLISINIKDYG